MFKDFIHWHAEKRRINNDLPRVFFDIREIWFCYLGENIGYEQDGRGTEFLRPIVVLKKFNNEILWAIPLTKNPKKGKYYFTFSFKDGYSTAILSQIRLIDAKRLKYKAGDIPLVEYVSLKAKIRQLLA